MRYLPAFVAATVLAGVLGVLGVVSLQTALNPSAEKVLTSQTDQGTQPVYGAR